MAASKGQPDRYPSGGRFSFFSRFASRFSLSVLPAFLADGFCGDLLGMVPSSRLALNRDDTSGCKSARAGFRQATPGVTSPASYARITNCARSRASSFINSRETCVLLVAGLMYNISAISALV